MIEEPWSSIWPQSCHHNQLVSNTATEPHHHHHNWSKPWIAKSWTCAKSQWGTSRSLIVCGNCLDKKYFPKLTMLTSNILEFIILSEFIIKPLQLNENKNHNSNHSGFVLVHVLHFNWSKVCQRLFEFIKASKLHANCVKNWSWASFKMKNCIFVVCKYSACKASEQIIFSSKCQWSDINSDRLRDFFHTSKVWVWEIYIKR